ncbi:MAG: tRNA (adenosine(37)-N6)-threonylcarbamoyltransferase complex dimerization subunit type 1 TsaB [Bdellovibrionaceae bacterium]|nr:tRNA (adenosine(37)-N6)-threonylcarbamoyltransferase complex dimerization subunit type 1 TsaB [Pseudobdellovibrionaceae bacterium]
MLTLCLDTSTSKGTVCLGENGHVLKSVSWHKQSSHSEVIVSAIENLYCESQKKIEDTQLLICGNGPGSFTGIRVALSFIRTMAHAMHLPVITVEDCWSIALNTNSTHSIAVALDAQKNMFFFGRYAWEGDLLLTKTPAQLISEDQLVKEMSTPACWITNKPDVFEEKNIDISKYEPHPSAEKMYQQVIRNLHLHTQITWEHVSPLYLRASAAEEVLKKKNS